MSRACHNKLVPLLRALDKLNYLAELPDAAFAAQLSRFDTLAGCSLQASATGAANRHCDFPRNDFTVLTNLEVP
jgi:hypothetical protein